MTEETQQISHGVDLDSTLAVYEEYEGPSSIGAPIPLMVERVKNWLENGERVDIFSARVHPSHGPEETEEATRAIKEWFEGIFGVEPIVTCMKDPMWADIWDDKTVRVDANLGTIANQLDIEDPAESDADGIGDFLTNGD